MVDTWDFCPNSRVVQELPPEEPNVTSFNGWDFTSKSVIPYRRKFSMRLHGIRWILNGDANALDIITNPTLNAGRLAKFYRDHRTYEPFNFPHEYLGTILVRFHAPVTIPVGLPNSFGLVEPFDVMLIHHNPGF